MQSPARPAHALLLPLLLLALAPAALAAPKKLPPSMPLCKKTDPQLNECLKKSIQASIPDLVKGLTDISVPSVDPVEIKKLHIDNSQGAINIKLTFTDCKFSGIGGVEVLSVEMDVNKPRLHARGRIPLLQLEGPYKIEGKVLLLPITGEGNTNLSLANSIYSADVEGEFVEKSGHRYWDVKSLDLRIVKPGPFTLHFENLFNGDQALGKQMNEFLNQNSADLLAEMKDPLEQSFSPALHHIARRLFIRVPFDDIFVD